LGVFVGFEIIWNAVVGVAFIVFVVVITIDSVVVVVGFAFVFVAVIAVVVIMIMASGAVVTGCSVVIVAIVIIAVAFCRFVIVEFGGVMAIMDWCSRSSWGTGGRGTARVEKLSQLLLHAVQFR